MRVVNGNCSTATFSIEHTYRQRGNHEGTKLRRCLYAVFGQKSLHVFLERAIFRESLALIHSLFVYFSVFSARTLSNSQWFVGVKVDPIFYVYKLEAILLCVHRKEREREDRIPQVFTVHLRTLSPSYTCGLCIHGNTTGTYSVRKRKNTYISPLTHSRSSLVWRKMSAMWGHSRQQIGACRHIILLYPKYTFFYSDHCNAANTQRTRI